MKAKLLLAAALVAVGSAALAQVHVRGYTRRDGTYVAPHVRSAPNSSRLDNWSTRGNVNPYTGRVGTQDPYAGSRVRSPSVYGSQDDQADGLTPRH